MSDMDRFTEFLLRIGAAYHAPPEPPREAMWAAIERARSEEEAGDESDPVIVAARAYHEPPAPPVDDMWGRIEAAWALRSGAPESARDAGLDALASAPWATQVERTGTTGPGRIGRWATGLAVAASLVVGIAIGRSSMGEPNGAAGPRMTAGDASPGGVVDTTRVADPAARRPVPADDAAMEPLESGPRLATDESDASMRPGAGERAGPIPDTSSPRPSSRDVAMRLATAQHMGRAETLLMAFQTGFEEEDDTTGLAEWARRLLGETRLLIDSSDGPERQRALLEELELVLAQIAGLSPEAADFERDMIADGIERQGTIARLRAASPQAGSGSQTGI